VVVFVGQVNDYKKHYTDTNEQLTNEKAKGLSIQAQADAARATAQESVRTANSQLEAAKQEINKLQLAAVDKDAQLAQAKSQSAIQAIDVTTLAGALKGSEETKTRMQEQLTQLRSGNDKYVTENAQLNQQVTNLQSQLDVTERERRLLAEQNTELRTQVDKQSTALRDAGVTGTQLSNAGNRAGAPPINGVVRKVQPIDGVLYASISVGAADSVKRGMQFNVVSRNSGAFLGVLVVEMVEQNEATGRLTGPRTTEVAPGAEVKTQL
jgi:chromosome segregation ATPase